MGFLCQSLFVFAIGYLLKKVVNGLIVVRKGKEKIVKEREWSYTWLLNLAE